VVHGDNLTALADLGRGPLGGTAALVYLDPPYAVGATFYSQLSFGDTGDAVNVVAYRDTWGSGLARYADMLAPRLAAARDLLCDDGALFVQCDWRANAIVRLLADETFGPDCFRNEIVWRRSPNLGRAAASNQLGRTVDSVFVYTKTAGVPLRGDIPTRDTAVPTGADGAPRGAHWDADRGAYYVTGPVGGYIPATLARLEAEGRIHRNSRGNPEVKYYLHHRDGVWWRRQRVDTLWDDPGVHPLRHQPRHQAWGYDTQKPLGLADRIVGWASRPGDLVVDAFCGSGTVAVAAASSGRDWVAVDASRWAAHVTAKRLHAAGAPACATSVGPADADWCRDQLEAWGAEPDGDGDGWRSGVDAGGVRVVAQRVGDAAAVRRAARATARTGTGLRRAVVVCDVLNADGVHAALRRHPHVEIRWAADDTTRPTFPAAGFPRLRYRAGEVRLAGWRACGDDRSWQADWPNRGVVTVDGDAHYVTRRRGGDCTTAPLTTRWSDWVDAWGVGVGGGGGDDWLPTVASRSQRTPHDRGLALAAPAVAGGVVWTVDATGRRSYQTLPVDGTPALRAGKTRDDRNQRSSGSGRQQP
jgi:hypothetical protein